MSLSHTHCEVGRLTPKQRVWECEKIGSIYRIALTNIAHSVENHHYAFDMLLLSRTSTNCGDHGYIGRAELFQIFSGQFAAVGTGSSILAQFVRTSSHKFCQ